MESIILSFSDLKASILSVGGKGTSLSKLANAGLSIPEGFYLTTEAYRKFVTANNLQMVILTTLKGLDIHQPHTLETISTTITKHFINSEIPSEIENSILKAFQALPGKNSAVAVRSSAVAEDLPSISFAGQYETYLNITNKYMLLEAIKKCWASLWTARAIAYRAHHSFSGSELAMAIVVQLMIRAEASGVMFTVNPNNGKDREVFINAAWGLGEAIVGGIVTPDTMIVDKYSGKLIYKRINNKEVMTICNETGTSVIPVPDSLKNIAVLNDSQVAQLCYYGRRIEDLFGMPMDIEWSLEKGDFAILQARPISIL